VSHTGDVLVSVSTGFLNVIELEMVATLCVNVSSQTEVIISKALSVEVSTMDDSAIGECSCSIHHNNSILFKTAMLLVSLPIPKFHHTMRNKDVGFKLPACWIATIKMQELKCERELVCLRMIR
jgi:hypothetical protein